MMPKASLNCWMAEWEKDSKMLAFLGMLSLVVLDLVLEPLFSNELLWITVRNQRLDLKFTHLQRFQLALWSHTMPC